MVGTWRKLVWVFEFWNEMLVSNIRCKKSVEESSSFRVSVLEFWEERGEKLMTCHLFLDNFLWNFMTFRLFSKVKFLKRILVSRKLKYLNFDIMRCSSFLKLVFRKRRFFFCYRKLIVFSCLQFADCYIWPRILSCGVILCFNHFLRNLSL